MFAAIRLILITVIVLCVGGGLWYVMNLKADLATARANNEKLEDGLKEQTALLEGMKKDIENIQRINKELSEQNAKQRQDVDALSKKFDKRDFGTFANSLPQKAQELVNRGTVNALRCIEIASGSPLTDEEKAAKTPIEANRECPNLIDPNFVSVN